MGFSNGFSAGVLALGLVTALLAAPVPAAAPKARAAPAPEVLPKGDPLAGAVKAEAERCQECHGVDGHGAGHSAGSEGRLPKLAGQSPEYILKQVRNFRTGERKHDIMNMMARSVVDADVVDIAAYFATQTPMKGDGTGDNPVAHKLYRDGDAARGIAACVTCHGPAGKGLAGAGAASPLIGGQEWRYLEKQLLDWRSGDRRNSPGGVMNQATRALTDAEIRALADYLAGAQ